MLTRWSCGTILKCKNLKKYFFPKWRIWAKKRKIQKSQKILFLPQQTIVGMKLDGWGRYCVRFVEFGWKLRKLYQHTIYKFSEKIKKSLRCHGNGGHLGYFFRNVEFLLGPQKWKIPPKNNAILSFIYILGQWHFYFFENKNNFTFFLNFEILFFFSSKKKSKSYVEKKL